MKESPLSTCERNFITQTIKQSQRLDGRKNDEFRNVQIIFSADWGGVLVSLGDTKVLAQATCELGLPRATHPNEGMMYINVEMGPMAAPHFEAGRNSELNVQITRTLERAFKDSRCVDLESLCVTAEELVWILRVELNVLDHGGNIIDCASIATLCALAHFKRPDVSIVEDDVHIHTAAEKELIPMVLHHYPVCVSYSTFDEGRIAVADPTAIEERTSESSMIFGLNSFGELCCLNLGGTTLTSSVLLLQCAKKAARHAKTIVNLVKKALEEDAAVRATGKRVGFTESMRQNKMTTISDEQLCLRLRNFSFKSVQMSGRDSQIQRENEPKMEDVETDDENSANEIALSERIIKAEDQVVIVNSNQPNIKWLPDDDDGDVDSANATESNVKSKKDAKQFKIKKKETTAKSYDDSDSEEDVKMIVQ